MIFRTEVPKSARDFSHGLDFKWTRKVHVLLLCLWEANRKIEDRIVLLCSIGYLETISNEINSYVC